MSKKIKNLMRRPRTWLFAMMALTALAFLLTPVLLPSGTAQETNPQPTPNCEYQPPTTNSTKTCETGTLTITNTADPEVQAWISWTQQVKIVFTATASNGAYQVVTDITKEEPLEPSANCPPIIKTNVYTNTWCVSNFQWTCTGSYVSNTTQTVCGTSTFTIWTTNADEYVATCTATASGDCLPTPETIEGVETAVVYSVEFIQLHETYNPANKIPNTTPKDDPPNIPSNMLYLVESPPGNKYSVTLDVDAKPTTMRGKLMHAVFEGGVKLTTGEGLFPSSGAADFTFDHPAGSDAMVTDFEIQAGFDLDESGSLDSGEIVQPLKVTNTTGGIIGFPFVRGASILRYALAQTAVDALITMNPLPHAGPLLQVFRDGTTAGIPVDKQPTTSSFINFNCFGGDYSEWLTHNSGAPFSASGSAQIPYHTWDPTTSFANLVGDSHQVEAAGLAFYTSAVEPYVTAYFATQAMGHVATFPAFGAYSVPHMSTSPPSWSFTTVLFDEPLFPDLVDDVNGAIGRGRMIAHLARYTVQKKSIVGVEYLEVTDAQYIGAVEDLYDFNAEAGLIAPEPARVQIGYGNGAYGAAHDKGIIYRDRIEFNIIIHNPWSI